MLPNACFIASNYAFAITKLVSGCRSDRYGKPSVEGQYTTGQGKEDFPFPCTPSQNQIQNFESGSFYLAKKRNFLLGLDAAKVRTRATPFRYANRSPQ
jgi:hypothetical protein